MVEQSIILITLIISQMGAQLFITGRRNQLKR